MHLRPIIKLLKITMLSDFTEVNEQNKTAESRVVKICLVKYKCVLVLLAAVFTVIQFSILFLTQTKSLDQIGKLAGLFTNYRSNISGGV